MSQMPLPLEPAPLPRLISVRRFLVVRSSDGERRIDITDCFWCGGRDYVCAAHETEAAC